MKLSSQDIDIIDRKIMGSLNAGEQKTWKEKMQSADFRLKYNKMQKSYDAITYSEHKRLKVKLQILEGTISSEKKINNKLRKGVIIAIIAMILAVLSLFYFGLFPINTGDETVTDKNLYATYYETHPNDIYPVTRGTLTKTQYAFSFYEAGDYTSAIEKFKRLDQWEENSSLVFFTALSYLELGDDSNAVKLLSDLLDDEKHGSEALWYLALTHLKEGDLDKASENLETLVETDGYKHEEAADILSQFSAN